MANLSEEERLRRYLRGRKVLALGTRIEHHGLNTVLIRPIPTNDHGSLEIGRTFSDAKCVPDSYDVILVAVAVGERTYSEEDRESLFRLVNHLSAIAERRDAIVPPRVPPVVVLSATDVPLDGRWVREHIPWRLRFVHYVWDDPGAPVAYFSAVWATVVRALEESLVHTLNLPSADAAIHLQEWLGNFADSDRAMILRIMERFRYYSAESIIRVLNGFFEAYAPLGSDDRLGFLDSLLPDNIWFSYLGRPNKSGPATLTLLAKTAWLRRLSEDRGPPRFLSYEHLLRDLIPAMLTLERGQRIVLVFVDDFLGSGGQFGSYITKFFAHLKAAVTQAAGEHFADQLWKKMLMQFAEDRNSRQVDLHALFTIGVRKDRMRKRFNIVDKDTLPSEARPAIGFWTQKVPSDNGIAIDVRIGVYIGDYTDSVHSVGKGNGYTRDELESALRRRQGIVRPRVKEHWGQFEPYGWKDCGGLVATYSNCQGNTLPVVWGEHDGWVPLFRRFFNPWDDGRADTREFLYRACSRMIKILSNLPDYADLDWHELPRNRRELPKRFRFFLTESKNLPDEVKQWLAFALFVRTRCSRRLVSEIWGIQDNGDLRGRMEEALLSNENPHRELLVAMLRAAD